MHAHRTPRCDPCCPGTARTRSQLQPLNKHNVMQDSGSTALPARFSNPEAGPRRRAETRAASNSGRADRLSLIPTSTPVAASEFVQYREKHGKPCRFRSAPGSANRTPTERSMWVQHEMEVQSSPVRESSRHRTLAAPDPRLWEKPKNKWHSSPEAEHFACSRKR